MILVVIPVTEERRAALEAAAPNEEFFYRSQAEVTLEDVQKADILIGNVPSRFLKDCPRLKWMQLSSAGHDPYNQEGVLPKGCLLTSAVGAYGLSVSEHALALLMAMNRKLHLYCHNQEKALWHDEGSVQSIEGSIILVLGVGDIGYDFARKAKAMGAYLIGTKRSIDEKPDCLDELHTLAELDTLLPRADVVAVCLPGSPQTHHLIDAGRLALMKPDSILVNVGRGSVVDTDALCAALQAHRLGGACVDVTDPEPLPADHPLWHCENAMITPHVAGSFRLPATLDRIAAIGCKNLKNYFSKKPLINRVL